MWNYLLVLDGTARNLWRFFPPLKKGRKEENSCNKFLSVWSPPPETKLFLTTKEKLHKTFLKKKKRDIFWLKLFLEDKHLPDQNRWANLFFQIKPIIPPNSINHIRQNSDTPENKSTNVEKTTALRKVWFVQVFWLRIQKR